MDCPNSSTLASLLTDAGASDGVTLWKHLEQCTRCRAELDRISDDTELQQWRDLRSSQVMPAGDSNAVQDLVKRLATRKSTIDSLTDRTTGVDDGVEPLILASFQPSDVQGELGKLGQYRVQRQLGHGGMAVVFEAIDTELNRGVALKILRAKHSDATSRERFLREARALASLKHPNIISIYSIDSTPDGQPFIAMEMADDGSMQDVIQRENEVSPRLAAEWIFQAANGLAAAHEAGMIHRDVKPSNILLFRDQLGSQAKLADFGLARFSSSGQSATQTGVLLGTPAYMSPEYIAAPESCDALSDIYGLGVTLYEMLTGEVPFRGAVHTVLQKIGRDQPANPRSLNALIPRDLETICLKAMHSDPKRRYSTAQAFADDLNRWLTGQPIKARPATKLEVMVAWCRRNKRVATLMGVVASLLVILATVSTYAALSIQQAAKDLRKEKETVEDTSNQLAIAAREALGQRRIAVESLNKMVTKVQTELGSRPGTLTLRNAILDVAFAGLEEITSTSDSTDSDFTTVEAHLRKGEIQDSLGKTSETVKDYEKAAALAQALYEAAPDSLDAQRSLGNALLAQADLATKRGGFDVAMPMYEKVLKLREAVQTKQPSDTEAVRALNTCLQRIGDVHYHRSEWDIAYGYFVRSLAIAKANAERDAESTFLRRDLALAFQRLGTIQSLRGQNAEAEEFFEQAMALNRKLLDFDHDNRVYQSDLAFITGSLSRVISLTGKHDEAAEKAREAIQYCVSVSNADPNDTDAKTKVGGGWLALHDVLLAAGKLSDAETALMEFVANSAQLAEANPTSSKYPMLAAHSSDMLAGLRLRQGKLLEARASYQESIRFLELCKKAADAKPEEFTIPIALERLSLAGMELALIGIEGEIPTGDLDSNVLYAGRYFLMYELARRGDCQRAIDLAEQMKNASALDAFVHQMGALVIARAYSLCYGRLNEADQLDEAGVVLRDRALDGCITALKLFFSNAILAQNPSTRNSVQKDLDFAAIRNVPAFQELFK